MPCFVIYPRLRRFCPSVSLIIIIIITTTNIVSPSWSMNKSSSQHRASHQCYLHTHAEFPTNQPTNTIKINAYTSCRARRNSTLSRRYALRKHSSAAQEQGPEAEAAFSASARAPRAPTGFRGCVRGARGGCPRSVRLGGGRLPVIGVSFSFFFLILCYSGVSSNLRSEGTRLHRRILPSPRTRSPFPRLLP